jgi:hypothetical protein
VQHATERRRELGVVTGFGATRLAGPLSPSFSIAKRIAPTSSVSAIQLIHCLPEP